METPAIELFRIPTIVVALIRRADELLLVEAQGPDDPAPVWMLPGAQVEEGEALLDALRRELTEETGLQIVGEPELAFEVEVDYCWSGTNASRFDVSCPGRQPPASPTATASRASGAR